MMRIASVIVAYTYLKKKKDTLFLVEKLLHDLIFFIRKTDAKIDHPIREKLMFKLIFHEPRTDRE